MPRSLLDRPSARVRMTEREATVAQVAVRPGFGSAGTFKPALQRFAGATPSGLLGQR